MCIVQHVITKSAFTYQPLKVSSLGLKKCKTSFHVAIIPFMERKPILTLFGGDGTYCFSKKSSRDYDKEKPSPFLKEFLRQSQFTATEREPKMDEITSNKA